MSAEQHPLEAQLLQAVESAVDDFTRIQQSHGKVMTIGKLDEIPLLYDQRAKAFDRLQQSLTEIWHCEMIQENRLLGKRLQDKIGQLLQNEKRLAAITSERRDNTREKMTQIRRGKKAMAGYHSANVMPKYFNSAS